MSDDVVKFAVKEGVAHITLNDPGQRNALTPAIVDHLVTLCDVMNRDRTIRAAILTGQGTAFSSGGSVRRMDDWNAKSPSPDETRDFYRQGIQRLPLAFDRLEVPIIAAVNGPAIGAGCDLTCMCDIRLAGRSARFAARFVKLGLVPGDGGAWLLPRTISASRAREMIFTGDIIDAETALSYGLVSAVVDDERLIEAAQALASRIAVNPPHALRMAKRLLREAQQLTLDGALQLSAAYQGIAHATEDHREAAQAFLEKRPPNFTNR